MLFLAIIIGFFAFSTPQNTQAGIVSDTVSSIVNWFNDSSTNIEIIDSLPTSLISASVLEAAVNLDPTPIKNETDTAVVSDSALLSEAGPTSAAADAIEEYNDQISVYTVHEGDTLSSIADMFDVSVNTILWANDVTVKTLKVGQVLVILPVSGIKYVVKKGDTIKSIATKYKGDIEEIISFNSLSADGLLIAGEEIIIPGGEEPITASTIIKTSNSLPSYSGYFIRPISSACRRTQGLHGWNRNAIDFGCATGNSVYAAAAGKVLISRSSGWNGGYGSYVVIQHANGSQTLYGHLSSPMVSAGQKVTQGQVIGLSGNTGKSTGPHLHFEIRGAKNPF
ncbi:MAG: peptidoglycan DD-metalloendopeptidase family protein [Minisyncoccia bacterium]